MVSPTLEHKECTFLDSRLFIIHMLFGKRSLMPYIHMCRSRRGSNQPKSLSLLNILHT